MPLFQTGTKEEHRNENDEATFLSNEKATRTSRPHIEKESVANPEPESGNRDAIGTLGDVEDMKKMPKYSDTDLSENAALQDHLDQNAEKDAGDCCKEVSQGSMANKPEIPPKPKETSSGRKAKSSAGNVTKNLSGGEGRRKFEPSPTKRIIPLYQHVYIVSRGMEKKFGFERKTKMGK